MELCINAAKSNKKSNLIRQYVEACNELRGPSPRLSARATQLQRNVGAVASRWRHSANSTDQGVESQTYRTDSVCLTTELTVQYKFCQTIILKKSLMFLLYYRLNNSLFDIFSTPVVLPLFSIIFSRVLILPVCTPTDLTSSCRLRLS